MASNAVFAWGDVASDATGEGPANPPPAPHAITHTSASPAPTARARSDDERQDLHMR